MKKRFDEWNEIKKVAQNSKEIIKFQHRHIIFMKVGENVGYEQDGKGKEFIRPILVYKKFNNRVFLGIPLTSKPKDDKFHFEFEYKRGKRSFAILSQIRLFDIKRAKYYDGKISKDFFSKLQEKLLELIVTPLQKEGECTKAICEDILPKIDKNVNKDKINILLTGCAGFIGSNFVTYFLEKYPNYHLINLDLLTYAGDLNNLKEVENHPNYTFIKGDIRDRELIEEIFKKYDIRGVIHFAAESHVDNSIKNPGVFVETNVNGTYNLIDVAKNYWMKKPFLYKEEYKECRFHHISTDEVYGTLSDDPSELFTENTPYAPNSPYSASKASSDMIVRSYHHTFGLNTIITNCSNNYGPKQHDEKLIPTIIRNALSNNPIPIYGDGKNIRDWLYVLDHCKGIDIAYHKGEAGETYNIGGRNERDNLYIVNTICEILDKRVPREKSYKELITFVEDRAGHDRRYAIDASKIENELGWMAEENFESGIVKTIEWYLKKYGYES